VEREVTVKAVFLALEKVRQSEQLLENTPVLTHQVHKYIASDHENTYQDCVSEQL
jgi:hypothetical protein